MGDLAQSQKSRDWMKVYIHPDFGGKISEILVSISFSGQYRAVLPDKMLPQMARCSLLEARLLPLLCSSEIRTFQVG